MTLLHQEEPAVSPLLNAGLLLAAIPRLDALGLPHPTAAEVLAATGASKSRAYELRAEVEAILPTLQRPPGRPPAPPPDREDGCDVGAISQEILAFLMSHPGAAVTGEARQRYSDGFRCKVLELAERHPELEIAALARAVGVPAPTLQDWLTAPRPAPAEPDDAPALESDPTEPRIASILEAYRRWDGDFAPFCNFVRTALSIPYGDTLIGRILAVYAGRRPQRRGGRSSDEKALRGALIRFFSGAQWFADGSPISLVINGKTFTFNWELVVDASSGALVGASLRDAEDAQAVTEAFQDGVATTGAPPLALSTDNGTANASAEVAAALGDTLHLRATPGRPQNDAPVEGAFGLFQQTAPPLVLRGDTDKALAAAILVLVLTVWARAVNHRPRDDRRGRTRVQLYRDEQPTDAQIAAAKAALEERRRRQERAHRTRQARLDPVVRALLDDAFARLGLDDPTGHVRDAIAGYPLDAVLAGLATFDGKRAAGTLPPEVGPRYLLGIVRNIAQQDEGLAIADALWRTRLDARDRALLALDAQRRATSGTPFRANPRLPRPRPRRRRAAEAKLLAPRHRRHPPRAGPRAPRGPLSCRRTPGPRHLPPRHPGAPGGRPTPRRSDPPRRLMRRGAGPRRALQRKSLGWEGKRAHKESSDGAAKRLTGRIADVVDP